MGFERMSDANRKAEGIATRRDAAVEALELRNQEVVRAKRDLQRALGATALAGSGVEDPAAEAAARAEAAATRAAVVEAERAKELAEVALNKVASEAAQLGQSLRDYLAQNSPALAQMQGLSARKYGAAAVAAASQLSSNRQSATSALNTLGMSAPSSTGGASGGVVVGGGTPSSSAMGPKPTGDEPGAYTVGGLPDGFVMFPVSAIEDPDTIDPNNFSVKGYTPADLAWGLKRVSTEVLPQVARGHTIDDLRSDDRAAGRSGSQSYGETYIGFFVKDPIRLDGRTPDGRFVIDHGHHRIWVAKRFGITHVPVRLH